MEYNIEEQRLNYIIDVIKKETLSCIYKRKSISEAIIKYRKDVLEEFKDDEDKVAEYFDHERYINEEAFRLIDKKLKELTVLREVPYFAKVVINETGETEQLYIGRFGLNREDDFEPLIVDWRAPIASVFYAGKLGKVSYNAPKGITWLQVLLKRQFIIKKGKLLGMFDSSSEIKDEILQMVLSKNAGDKLKDIIMTIQEEQDKLIRFDRNKTIVINGVAGSGKTTVALHRVAYLLYNYRDVLENKVLIMGPNNIFMDYISAILPSLGETSVKQLTFREFAEGFIKTENIMSFKESMENIINGNTNYINQVKYKESEEFLKLLDDYILKLNNSYFQLQDVRFYNNIIVSIDEIKDMFNIYFKDMPLFRRSNKIRRIINSKIKDETYRLVNEINKNHKEKLISLSETERTLEENNMEFIRKLRVKEIIREAVKVKLMLKWLQSPDIINIYNEFNNNQRLTFQDLSPILYLSLKLNGTKMKNEIKHIIIDEAQDFSTLQFKVLSEITGCKSYTIVGDTNQRIIPLNGINPMENIHAIYSNCDVEYFNLNTSYRSTSQIMEYSNKLLDNNHIVPIVREGNEVLEDNFNNLSDLISQVVLKIGEFKEKGYESIGVICRSAEDTTRIGKLIKEKIHINIFENEDSIYKGGEVIIPAYFAKGMEFDGVINIYSYGNKNSLDERRLKYVMATRALHEMCWYQMPLGGNNDVQ